MHIFYVCIVVPYICLYDSVWANICLQYTRYIYIYLYIYTPTYICVCMCIYGDFSITNKFATSLIFRCFCVFSLQKLFCWCPPLKGFGGFQEDSRSSSGGDEGLSPEQICSCNWLHAHIYIYTCMYMADFAGALLLLLLLLLLLKILKGPSAFMADVFDTTKIFRTLMWRWWPLFLPWHQTLMALAIAVDWVKLTSEQGLFSTKDTC